MRSLIIAILVESLVGCASGRPRASTEDFVVAVVLGDVIAENGRWGTPVVCAAGHTNPTPALLGLVRSSTLSNVGVCSDLAAIRSTGVQTYTVFWNQVEQRESQQYGIQAGFSCGLTCGKLYQYYVEKSNGVWHVLGKAIRGFF